MCFHNSTLQAKPEGHFLAQENPSALTCADDLGFRVGLADSPVDRGRVSDQSGDHRTEKLDDFAQ
jgi:hypothetical protein